jgi:hypothetical protein
VPSTDTDAAVPDAVVAVPAIVESRERAAPSAAETAAVLAGVKRAETKHKLDPVRRAACASLRAARHSRRPWRPYSDSGRRRSWAASSRRRPGGAASSLRHGGGSGCAGGVGGGAPHGAPAAIASAAIAIAARCAASKPKKQLASGRMPRNRAAAEPSRSAARPSHQPRGHLGAGPRDATAGPAPQRRRTPSGAAAKEQQAGQRPGLARAANCSGRGRNVRWPRTREAVLSAAVQLCRHRAAVRQPN